MTDHRLELQPHLDTLYHDRPRRLAFDATTPEAFALWRADLRRAVTGALGIAGRIPPREVAATRIYCEDRGLYHEGKYLLDAGEGVQVPAYVLVPHAEPPYQPVLVHHGHNPSVQYILGNYPDAQTAAEMRAIDNNYAQRLAEAGYLVCAVEQRGFGERVTPQIFGDGETFTSACRHLAFEYLAQGRTLLGERVWDGMLAASFLLARDDIVPGALACTGNSGGGTTTLWQAVLDDRITVIVPGSYFCSFKASIHAMWHCECNYVPGVLSLFEMGDLAAALAPRPFCAIQGEQDPIYPVAASREQFETVRRAYALHGAESSCALKVHPGAHRYHFDYSRDWLARWL